MKTRPNEMSLLERMRWQETLRLKLMSELEASRHSKCGDCASIDSEGMPVLADGRSFCCAVRDILEGSEQAVCWSEMQQIADWAGIGMKHLREAHEGYIRWAVMDLPQRRADLPESFRPFSEDPSMVETPAETMRFVRDQRKKTLQYL